MTERVDEPNRQALEELSRQRRLIDQAITMQAALRDRDQALGTVLILVVLIASLIGVAFAFAGANPSLTFVGITADRAVWLGWLAVGISALSLVELVVDRRGAAQRRADAVRVLAALKAEYRVPPSLGDEVVEAARLSERYAQAMEGIPAVPERVFNRLKAAHLRKIEISKQLSRHPGMSHRQARRVVAERARHADSDVASK